MREDQSEKGLSGPPLSDHASRIIAGRYLVERTLKAGDAVETLLARDVPQGRRVVVKRARAASVSAAAQMRLEHEAQIPVSYTHLTLPTTPYV